MFTVRSSWLAQLLLKQLEIICPTCPHHGLVLLQIMRRKLQNLTSCTTSRLIVSSSFIVRLSMTSRRRNLVRPIFCANLCFIPLTESSVPSSVSREITSPDIERTSSMGTKASQIRKSEYDSDAGSLGLNHRQKPRVFRHDKPGGVRIPNKPGAFKEAQFVACQHATAEHLWPCDFLTAAPREKYKPHLKWDGRSEILAKLPHLIPKNPLTPPDRIGIFGFQSHPKRIGM